MNVTRGQQLLVTQPATAGYVIAGYVYIQATVLTMT